MIITKLNEQMCQEIAIAGNGIYARTENSNSAVKALTNALDKLNKSEVESKVYSSYDEKYQVIAWILVILLVLEFFILDRKNRIFSKIKLFKS